MTSSRIINSGRDFSSELPRSPPSPLPAPENFSSPSRPRQYYSRPVTKRELPGIPRTWPTVALLGTVGLAAWGVFLTYAANQERLSSSITQQVLINLKDSPEVQEVLGDAIRPEPVWYLNGDPRVDGVINVPQGNVDLKFRVKGHKDSGTVHFTSIRRDKGKPFTIIRFKVIADGGVTVDIPTYVP